MDDRITIEAVIGALREVLDDAELRDEEETWDVETINRWIDQLPDKIGKVSRLKLIAYGGHAAREDAVGHLRATIKYLELKLQQIPVQTKRPWWRFGREKETAPSPEPIDAEFKMIESPDSYEKPFALKD